MEEQDKHRGFLKKLLDMENLLIKSIKDSRQKMIEKMSICDLEERFVDTIDRIFFKRQKDVMLGRDAHELHERLK